MRLPCPINGGAAVALALLLQVIPINTDADRRMLEAREAITRAQALEQQGRYPEARSLFEQALSISESVRGPDDSSVARVLFDLAGNALQLQDNARSRALYERVLRIFGGVAEPDAAYVLMAKSRLALLDQRGGQPQQAETTLRDVLPALEREVGAEHPWYLQSLVTFANLRQNAGDLDEAERLDRQILATVERTGQTGTLIEAGVLNNLADVRRARADYAGAEPLFRRSVALGESLLGADSLFVATGLQNLGIIARERKDYPAAIDDYERALAIRERLLGPNDPAVAAVLTNMANVYRAMGDDPRALELHFRALRLWEDSVGPYARETLLVVGNIARTYASIGDVPHALEFQRRADAILELQLELYLATGSERQKLTFVRTVAERTDRTLSLHLKQAPENADAAALGALVLLQRKDRVQDVMTDIFASVRRRVTDPADRVLMDQLKDTTAALARVALGRAPAGHEPIEQVEARKERLEATLSEHSTAFRAEMPPITLDAVQRAIPGDAALLEFAVYHPFDPEAERNDEAYGPAHYAVYVIAKHGAPVGIDLGAADDIDPLIARLRDSLRDPAAADVNARARAVDERVVQPLRAALGGASRLLIAPDGALNLVPFEALVDEHGRYLVERYATTYLTSGRELLRMQWADASAGRPVIVADPLFGEPAAAASSRHARGTSGARRSVTVGADAAGLYFAPLSGTAVEAHAIKSLFPNALLLTGRRATKASLEHLDSPSILHIASHGFFLDDSNGAGGDARAQNPLLRSGLALAGANLRGTRGDGILTALEAAGLDLWGTRLVTLSACDTGVGEVRNGEGVYGLRRAFMLAGAETLVMSLWPVTDASARDTMVGYYARLRAGAGRGDALRQAKLAILHQSATRHPYYWAAFIQSGDWTRLRTTR